MILKRVAAAAALLLLILCAGCAGYSLGRTTPAGDASVVEVSAPIEDPDPLTSFRTERGQLRQMHICQLNDVIYGGNASEEIVRLAQATLLDLMRWSEQETTLEGVLSLRGFDDALVTVHTDSVNVMIRAQALTEQECAVILELVLRETGISGGNVKIIPIN